MEEKVFDEIKIKEMFLWKNIYFVKIDSENAEYKPGHSFFFLQKENVLVDSQCMEYNDENSR